MSGPDRTTNLEPAPRHDLVERAPQPPAVALPGALERPPAKSRRKLARWLLAVIAAAAAGSFLGSLVGGFLATSIGFNAINWMAAFAVGAAVLLLFVGLWPAERKKRAAEEAASA